MIRAQRRAHVRAWLILAPLALLGLVIALATRPGEPSQPAPSRPVSSDGASPTEGAP